MRLTILSTVAAATAMVAPTVASAAVPHAVAPGESLYSVAAADGLSVDQLAAANGLSPNAQLMAGSTLMIPPQTSASAAGASGAAVSSSLDGDGDTDGDVAATQTQSAAPTGATAPTQAPAVGTSIVGRMTWFGGPHDPGAQGAPASGLGWRTDGMSFYNYGSLAHRWLIRFPWNQTLNMTQIDIGPAPWTGNPFDIAFSALPNTPYQWSNWPNPVVTGIYQGG
jgi:LysM repeat protein